MLHIDNQERKQDQADQHLDDVERMLFAQL
jgi:hypothetical protein